MVSRGSIVSRRTNTCTGNQKEGKLNSSCLPSPHLGPSCSVASIVSPTSLYIALHLAGGLGYKLRVQARLKGLAYLSS